MVASVSCIYGLGNPEDYKDMMFGIRRGDEIGRDEFLGSLVSLLFERERYFLSPGEFSSQRRCRGSSAGLSRGNCN